MTGLFSTPALTGRTGTAAQTMSERQNKDNAGTAKQGINVGTFHEVYGVQGVTWLFVSTPTNSTGVVSNGIKTKMGMEHYISTQNENGASRWLDDQRYYLSKSRDRQESTHLVFNTHTSLFIVLTSPGNVQVHEPPRVSTDVFVYPNVLPKVVEESVFPALML